jgi:multidrug efflux pump subunit AcrB
MTGLLRGFLDNRIAPHLLAILCCLAGLVAISRLNTQFFPSVDVPTISIAVVWPGASADDVAQSVLDLVEPEVRFIDGVKEMTSYATDGSARTVLEFEDGTDMTQALSDVEQRLSTVTGLPNDAERPVISRAQFFETVARVSLAGNVDEASLLNHAKALRDKLLQSGIERVEISGKREQEIWTEIDPRMLRQLDLTTRNVADRIASLARDEPLGTVEGGSEKNLRARGRLTTADGIASIELRSFETGQRLLVRDVAIVRDAYREGQLRLFREGENGLVLDVQRLASSDSIRSMKTVEAAVVDAKASLPASITIDSFDVRAKVVEQRLNTLTDDALTGFFIVVGMTLVFFSMRVALVVALSIPISMLATVAFMWATGQTINALSLIALILIVGIVVDFATVVGEHAVVCRERGMSPYDAALEGAKRMFAPVVSSVATTQAAFLPMFLITGVVGQILSAIPLVVVVSLFAALLQTFFTLPAQLRWAFEVEERRKDRPKGWLTRTGNGLRWGIDAAFAALRDGPVRWSIRLAFRWRYMTLALAVASLILSFGLVAGGRVPFTFFPTPEPETVFADVTFAPGLPEARKVAALADIERAAYSAAAASAPAHEKIVVHTLSTLGSRGTVRGENVARIEVELTAGEERSVRTNAYVAAWRKAVPPIVGLERIAILPRRTGPPGTDIDIRLSGPEVVVLKQAALEIQRGLQGFPGLIGVGDDLPYGRPDVNLTVNARGRALGLTTQSVAAQVRGGYQGLVATRFTRGDEEITVLVRKSERERGLAGLLDLTLRTPSGAEVRLSDAVTVEERQAFSVVQRRDGVVAVSVTANVIPGTTTPDAVIGTLRSGLLKDVAEKYNVDFSFHGRAETQRRAFADLGTGFGIVLLLIYLILALTFQSWAQPLLVMSVIPFGIVGAIVGHWIMGFELALFSIVGILGLSGILVTGSIILVDGYNELRAGGATPEQASVEAGASRFRALFLTTATTVGGIAPLMLEKSLQAQFLIPIAITMTYGLIYGTLLVLYVIPALIGVASDLARIGGGLRAGGRWVLGLPRAIA